MTVRDKIAHNPAASADAVLDGLRVIREHERKRLTGVSRAHWFKLESQGLAPKRVKLGAVAHGWFVRDIIAWLEALRTTRSVSGSEAA